MALDSVATLRAEPDDEVLIPYTMALLAFCLAAGLLMATAIFPLGWLPGQLPLTLVLCYALPLAGVFSRRYQATLDGLTARQYSARETLLVAVVGAGLLVGVPLLEWSRLHPGVDWKTWPFGVPVLVSLVAVGLAWVRATGTLGYWQALHVQPWEDGATDQPVRRSGFDEQTGGRVNRTRQVWLMWREFAGWGIVLSLVSFAAGVLNFGGTQPPAFISILLFGGYVLTGLSLIGRSALLRLLAEWRLDRLSVAPTLGKTWVPTTATLTVGLAALIALAVLAHVLDLIHIVLAWLWGSTLGPVLYAILSWLNRTTGTNANLSGMQKAFNPGSAAPPRHLPPARHVQSSPLLWWITHVGPWIVAALVAALVLRAYLRYRKEREPGSPWWRIFPAIWLELRRLLRALLGPVMALAGQVALRAGTAAAQRQEARRRTTRRPSEMLPRELIAYFYGLALAAVARLGQPRRPGQTPGEYALQVRERLGPTTAAFDDLTAGFVEARYSPHEVPQDLAGQAQTSWSALKESLKRMKRGNTVR